LNIIGDGTATNAKTTHKQPVPRFSFQVDTSFKRREIYYRMGLNMKKASVATVSVWMVVLSLTFGAMAQTVGVQPGQFMKYNLKVSSMGATVQGTIKANIQSVSGTTVSGTIETSVTGTSMPTSFSIDVATGYGSTGMPTTLIIPANLTVGATIPGTAMTVTGVTDRSYAGASRKVVYTTGSLGGLAGLTYYWDQFTGMFVEMSGSGTYQGYSYSYEFKTTETNMWTGGFSVLGTGPLGLDWLIWIVIIVVVVVVIAVITLLLRKKKPAAAPAPPPQAQPPPPPPPAPPQP
jgi:hypothetical protein